MWVLIATAMFVSSTSPQAQVALLDVLATKDDCELAIKAFTAKIEADPNPEMTAYGLKCVQVLPTTVPKARRDKDRKA